MKENSSVILTGSRTRMIARNSLITTLDKIVILMVKLNWSKRILNMKEESKIGMSYTAKGRNRKMGSQQLGYEKMVFWKGKPR